MKNYIIALFLLTTSFVYGQSADLYNPQADAAADLQNAIKQAQQQGKHVLVQVGGNWCSWCIKLHKFYTTTPELDSLMQADFVVVKINYSKDNKNLPVLQTLNYPQRFGFPVWVILNAKGERLHTQDTGLLEAGDGYDAKKIETCLKNWSPAALSPDNYK